MIWLILGIIIWLLVGFLFLLFQTFSESFEVKKEIIESKNELGWFLTILALIFTVGSVICFWPSFMFGGRFR
jgi:hypothetical protein